MAFGADLKDFVSAFATGYNMMDSKEDREWKKKEREMSVGRYDREGKWHEEEQGWKKRSWDREGDWHNQDVQWRKEGRDIDVSHWNTTRSDQQATQAHEWGRQEKQDKIEADKRFYEQQQDAIHNAQRNKELLIEQQRVYRETHKANSEEIQNQIDSLDKFIREKNAAKPPVDTNQPANQNNNQTPSNTTTDKTSYNGTSSDPGVDPTQTGAIPDNQTADQQVASLTPRLGQTPSDTGDSSDYNSPENMRKRGMLQNVAYREDQNGDPRDAMQNIPNDTTSRMSPEERRRAIQAIPDDTTQPGDDRGAMQNYSSRGEPQSGKEIAYRMVNDLVRDTGMPRDVAIGVVGQLAHESIGFTTMQEVHPLAGRGGLGYAQWTGPRRRDFEAFAKYKGLDPRSYEANYQYLLWDMTRGPERGVMSALHRANSSEEAGRIFTDTFLRPGIPGYKSRSKWTGRVAELFASKGGMIKNYADGGVVSGVPEDPEEQRRLAEQQLLQDQMNTPDQPVTEPAAEQKAIPDEVTSKSNQITDENPIEGGTGEAPASFGYRPPKKGEDLWKWGQEAVKAGLITAAKELNSDTTGAIDDPDYEKRVQSYNNGYGGADDQIMKQVYDIIDPKRTMEPTERSMKAIGMVYRYYKENGNEEKARQAAKDMVLAKKEAAVRFMTLAQGAIQNGDLDNAMKATVAAFMNVPNGKNAQITKTENGDIDVSIVDAETGKTIKKHVVSPDNFAATVMEMNPATFDKMLMLEAGEKPREFKQERPGTDERGNNEEDINSALGNLYAPQDITNKETGEVLQKANPYASLLSEKMQGHFKGYLNDALTFKADNTLSVDRMAKVLDPTDRIRPTIEPVTGNPDVMKITKDGDTVYLTHGAYKNWLADVDDMLGAMQKQDAKTEDTKQKTAARGRALDKYGENVVGAFQRGDLMPHKGTPEKMVPSNAGRHDVPQHLVPDASQAIPDDTPPRRFNVIQQSNQTPDQGVIPDDQAAQPQRDRQALTPGGTADQIWTGIFGGDPQSIMEKRDGLQRRLDQMKQNPQEYGKAIADTQAQIAEMDKQVPKMLEDQIAQLEEEKKNKDPSDVFDYDAQINQRHMLLREYYSRLKERTSSP